MDQALDLQLLSGALEGAANLPTPEELRALLARAEVDGFFAAGENLHPQLLETAWNLHHVGTVRPALQLYGPERQVQANAVAAHIFDLALRSNDLPEGARLVLAFAAQVSSIRGDRAPNAAALAKRLSQPLATLPLEPGRVSLELGCALLSLDRPGTLTLLRRALDQLAALGLQETAEVRVPAPTGLDSVRGVIYGCRHLLDYLTHGNPAELNVAREAFSAAINPESALADLDSRWVAAHLLDLCDDLESSSVWAALPDDAPAGVGRAMTLGDPPVMTLWPPQISLLRHSVSNPLRNDVKRAVITFPTSAGKTLLTQLVIAHHLAEQETGVCVVAPRHSLCREIRRGLDRRLWILDCLAVEDEPLGAPIGSPASVVVMTPERLSARLRADEEALLGDFGLFVLDEAHLLGDDTRGWTFETTITRLHQITEQTDHRLLLLSAAMAGAASIQTWLGVSAPLDPVVTRWRGPRRLHATYRVVEDARSRKLLPPTGRQRFHRMTHELKGRVDLYIDQGTAVASRAALIGSEVRVNGRKTEGPTRAEQLTPIVELAAKAGPVLTVHATRDRAERLAKALASGREEENAAAPLVDLVSERLGPSHPLVAVLKRGVAYHHAALPVDIQIEIEDGVRGGLLNVVCSTTTLTEGVNLPVRAVVVCERGYFDGSVFRDVIQPADLLNAAGRAGRAARETSGWVIIAGEPKGPHPRSSLRALDREHDIHSRLNTNEALEALGEYEALLSDTADQMLTEVPPIVDGFLSYCWYLADAASVVNSSNRTATVIEGIERTLAWHQLSPEVRARWESLAERLVETYESTEEVRRARWGRSGVHLTHNVLLEDVARGAGEVAGKLDDENLHEPIPVLEALLDGGRLEKLLSLLPERARRFRRHRSGRTEYIDVDLRALVVGWTRGVDLPEIANAYLSAVDSKEGDDTYRLEQLSAFVTEVCGYHLPWTLGILLEWIREDEGIELCPRLPAFLHYGIDTPVGLCLMVNGVRSRRLARIVGTVTLANGVGTDDVREWLSQLGIEGWKSTFHASPAEVADLVQFAQDPTSGLYSALLNGQTVTVPVKLSSRDLRVTEGLGVNFAGTGVPPMPLAALRPDGAAVAEFLPSQQQHLSALVHSGFRLSARIEVPSSHEIAQAHVRILPE